MTLADFALQKNEVLPGGEISIGGQHDPQLRQVVTPQQNFESTSRHRSLVRWLLVA